MKKVIVTDLTRFDNPEIVCIAAIDLDSGECLRPMPYIKTSRCKELNIQPGAIFTGEFSNKKSEKPHLEDMNYRNLKFNGPCSPDEFRKVLEMNLKDDISSGFGIDFQKDQKHIPKDMAPDTSIITIKVDSDNIVIHEDQFKPGKIKLTLTDASGKTFKYLSITDLGFHDYAMKHHEKDDLKEVQDFIASQEEIFLRIGLSRNHKAQNGKEGFWLQVNGIYTFPEYREDIRSYS